MDALLVAAGVCCMHEIHYNMTEISRKRALIKKAHPKVFLVLRGTTKLSLCIVVLHVRGRIPDIKANVHFSYKI